jgi:hypothetical protein
VRTFGRAVALGYSLAGAVPQGTAVNPVPFSRKVVQALASASIMLSCFETNVIDKPRRAGVQQRTSHRSEHLLRTLQPAFFLPATRLAKQKSRAWIVDPDTAPRRRDFQLVAVPYFVLPTSLFGH